MEFNVTDFHGQPLTIGNRVRRLRDHTGDDYAGIITFISPIYCQHQSGAVKFHSIEVTRDNGANYITFSDKVVLAPNPSRSSMWRRLTRHLRPSLWKNAH